MAKYELKLNFMVVFLVTRKNEEDSIKHEDAYVNNFLGNLPIISLWEFFKSKGS